MKIVIVCFGDSSRKMAELLKRLLSDTMPWLEIHIPSEDNYEGIGWFSCELDEMRNAQIAILSLTQENIHMPWLLFEAGALANQLDRDTLFPVLLDIKAADLSGPLAQFKPFTLDKVDLLQLAKIINKKSVQYGQKGLDEGEWINAFEQSWSKFKASVSMVQSGSPHRRMRSDRAVLYEILTLSRVIARALDQSETEERTMSEEDKTHDKTSFRDPPSLRDGESLSDLAKLAKELFVDR